MGGWLKFVADELERQAPRPPERLPREEPAAECDSSIPKLVLSLRRTDAIRHLAEYLLAGGQPEDPYTEDLVDAVTRSTPSTWKRAVVAAWCLGQVPMADEKTAAATRLSVVLDGRVKQDYFGPAVKQTLRVSAVLGVPIAFVRAFASMPDPFHSPGSAAALLLFAIVGGLLGAGVLSVFVVGPLLVPALMARDKTRMQRVRAQVAETLGELQAPESVDALTAAALEMVSRVRKPALDALIKVLPAVTDKWYGRLSMAAMLGLCKLIYDCDRQDALVILHALERAGTGRAADPLEDAVGRCIDGSILEEGRRVVTVLQARRQREEAAAVLLRAAGEAPNETLLRPAANSGGDSPAVLLRAAGESE